MILGQMQYEMGNGGRMSGRRELMMTSITVSSYLVWQWGGGEVKLDEMLSCR